MIDSVQINVARYASGIRGAVHRCRVLVAIEVCPHHMHIGAGPIITLALSLYISVPMSRSTGQHITRHAAVRHSAQAGKVDLLQRERDRREGASTVQIAGTTYRRVRRRGCANDTGAGAG